MSLFTLKETRASDLTQFYQLSVPEPASPATNLIDGDLDRWFFRWLSAAYPPATEIEREAAAWTFANPLSDLVRLAKMHPILVRCMDAAADHTTPSDKDQRQLNDLIETYISSPFVLWTEDGADIIRSGRIDKRQVSRFLLLDFIAGIEEGLFARCIVCQSAFAQGRRGVKFCSERCLNRWQQQKFRAKDLAQDDPDDALPPPAKG